MGADKNSSRRRWRLQKDEHSFQHTSPIHYPSWPSPRIHWSATGPKNQQTTIRAKTHQHAQQKLARLAACAAPVRPMACAGQRAGQVGGYSSRTTNVTESLSDFSRPWNKNTPKNTTCTEGKLYTKPSKTTPNRPKTDQQCHDPKTHESSNSPEANPTSGIHRSDRSHTPVRLVKPGQLGMNSTRGSTLPKPTPDLPNRSTDLHKTLGIVGTPHEESIAKFLSTKTCQIKRNLRTMCGLMTGGWSLPGVMSD
jgi:hypothetical protein